LSVTSQGGARTREKNEKAVGSNSVLHDLFAKALNGDAAHLTFPTKAVGSNSVLSDSFRGTRSDGVVSRTVFRQATAITAEMLAAGGLAATPMLPDRRPTIQPCRQTVRARCAGRSGRRRPACRRCWPIGQT